MLKEELIQYVEYIQDIQSETEDIEVKAAFKGNPKVYDSLSSFSNKSGGGVIIFGVDENKNFEVVGVHNLNNLQKNIKNQCNEMTPKVRGNFTNIRWENGKDILALEVPEMRQEEKPCYQTARGINSGSYIRVGDSDERMTPIEIYSLISFRQQAEDDLRIIERATLEDLNEEALKNYIEKINESRPNFSKLGYHLALEKLGIIVRKGKEYKPTLAGLLCFGLYTDLIMPQLFIAAVVVPGYDIGDTGELGERFIDNRKISGTIPEMLNGATDFITRNMKRKTIIRSDTGKRDDKFEYPVKAIREALINSLVHRDYSTYSDSSYISIRMFNDRLEISNPGGLYGGLTIEELGLVHNPTVRNKNIVRMLEELNIIENRSTGIITMINEMRGLRLEPPKFEDKRGSFLVTFKNHNLMTKKDQDWLGTLGLELTENEAYALVFIKNNGNITNGDYQRINNVNRDKALFELKNLITKDIITAEGVGSGTYYILKNMEYLELQEVGELDDVFDNIPNKMKINNEKVKISDEKVKISDEKVKINNEKVKMNDKNLKPNEIKIIEYLERNQQIANREARKLLGLSSSGVSRIFRVMQSKKLIIKQGNNRNRIYLLNVDSKDGQFKI